MCFFLLTDNDDIGVFVLNPNLNIESTRSTTDESLPQVNQSGRVCNEAMQSPEPKVHVDIDLPIPLFTPKSKTGSSRVLGSTTDGIPESVWNKVRKLMKVLPCCKGEEVIVEKVKRFVIII